MVKSYLEHPQLASMRDERSYDDLLPLERDVRKLLFDRPLVSTSVLTKNMEQLGLDYAKAFGEEFESIQNKHIELRQNGLI